MSEASRTGELGARAATDRGETGDKIPGFDPAAAPMETDAEAGGAPSGPIPAAPFQPAEQHRPPQSSTGSAMRAMPGVDAPAGGRTGWWVALAIVVLVVLAVLAAVTIS